MQSLHLHYTKKIFINCIRFLVTWCYFCCSHSSLMKTMPIQQIYKFLYFNLVTTKPRTSKFSAILLHSTTDMILFLLPILFSMRNTLKNIAAENSCSTECILHVPINHLTSVGNLDGEQRTNSYTRLPTAKTSNMSKSYYFLHLGHGKSTLPVFHFVPSSNPE